ncbi:helix-turn-helix transcriptional regulator [Dokdonia sp.]|uniref:helix-turn-helix domain-containing protein n=1 Tax=Dokdonia sp. TaxID=2024995 RepID=UPI0032639D6D
MSDLQKILINNLNNYLLEHNMSKGEMAKKIDIEQSRFSRIINGKVEPGISTIEQISKKLEISAAELLTDMQNPTTSLLEKILRIESLNSSDQKLVNDLLDSLSEKTQLQNMQDLKIKTRLEELDKART